MTSSENGVKARHLVTVLKKLGFRQVSDHGEYGGCYINPKGTFTSVPCADEDVVFPKLFRWILSDAGISEREFFQLLKPGRRARTNAAPE